ncbi:MAG: tetratricopeptide repeat protein [Pyrinomonadaceae bacterium]|nr:tetratricopeptide repeat protein [Pyrinomonadaceae bacterium]
MLLRFRLKAFYALALSLLFFSYSAIHAQKADSTSGEDDPATLFARGQDAHARGEMQAALQLYEQAIKLQPELPEAEYQRANVLLALNRLSQAEQGFRRAAELRGDWALPRAALGSLLARQGRDREAEPVLRRALQLNPQNLVASVALADLRTRAGDTREALQLWRQATEAKDATVANWLARSRLERAAGDQAAATSLDRALTIDPNDAAARLERAERHIEANAYAKADEDIRVAEQAAAKGERRDPNLTLRFANLYARAGNKEAAQRSLDTLDEATRKSPEAVALRVQITGEVDKQSVVALEDLLKREPRNAALLARLGEFYRTADPSRALEHFRRAVEIEPRNVDYATGYGAALVQLRRYEEAASVLQRILASAPDTYAAHANLATALGELKRYREALAEYQWLQKARPTLAITNYFIARTLDLLGEYQDAHVAYEAFLAQADVEKNRMEIERVALRLPILRNQINRGEGVRHKKN